MNSPFQKEGTAMNSINTPVAGSDLYLDEKSPESPKAIN